jgi:hypothetical protein
LFFCVCSVFLILSDRITILPSTEIVCTGDSFIRKSEPIQHTFPSNNPSSFLRCKSSTKFEVLDQRILHIIYVYVYTNIDYLYCIRLYLYYVCLYLLFFFIYCRSSVIFVINLLIFCKNLGKILLKKFDLKFF